jgi:phosphoglycolate phosphatase
VVVGWGYGQADFGDAATTSGPVHVATVAELRKALGV